MSGRRSGKSLLELIVIMGILSSIIMLAGKTFVFLMRADAQGRKSLVQNAGFSRLANRFRRDVRSAKSAELFAAKNENTKRLRLTMPDGRLIEYRPAAKHVSVVILDGKQIRGRERYLLDDGESRVEIENGPPRIVSLVRVALPPAAKRSSAEAFPQRTTRVEAMLGRNLRFTRSAEKAAASRPKTAPKAKPKS